MARIQPVAGPPAPSPLVIDAKAALETSDDPLDVIAAALALHDLYQPLPPMGGGLAIRDRARPYAQDVLDALRIRGWLP